MLNFRSIKKDYSSSILKQGKEFFDQEMVLSARIVSLTPNIVRLSCKVMGNFDNTYECEIEIDRKESMTVDSNCDCTYKYDCQHLAAVIFYLEVYLDKLVVEYSKETNFDKAAKLDEDAKETLKETIKVAKSKEVKRKGKEQEKELLDEYIGASEVLGRSPFFLSEEDHSLDEAELAIIVSCPEDVKSPPPSHAEIALALRLPFRSKPLNVPDIKEFLDAVRYNEPLYISSKRYYLNVESFDQTSAGILKHILNFVRYPEKRDQNLRHAYIGFEHFGILLAHAHSIGMSESNKMVTSNDEADRGALPCLYSGNLEEPLRYSPFPAILRFEIEYLETPAAKLLLNPLIVLENNSVKRLEDVHLFECANPGMIHKKTYYRFQPNLKRKHLRNLEAIRRVTIPEPLFGTFVENSLPELLSYAEIANKEIIDKFVTLPYAGQIQAECDIHYLNGELEASIHFVYGKTKVSSAASQLKVDHIESFVTKEGVMARDLAEEQKIIEDLFQDFVYDATQGTYTAKTDKKIVEFMTEVIPRNQHSVTFNCPENLLDQFIYDETTFKLSLKETDRVDMYEVDLNVNGHLSGLTVDLLWECLASKRSYVELVKKTTSKNDKNSSRLHKILVLDLEKLAPVVQIFDEIGINKLETHKEKRPLWSLASIDATDFKDLPIDFSISSKLKMIQQQMLGKKAVKTSVVPKEIKADLRNYQVEGVNWLDRLRNMHLSGILADDMGLGKTLQAIIAITQHKKAYPKDVCIVVCPTSLVYNWKEEINKFHSKLKVLVVDGTPQQRKKLIKTVDKYDVLVTSYSLLQKDIEQYQEFTFGYAILDEAQHIKNRGTRNAKSVKMLQAAHKLILTGTPIENTLEELWSLFDYLMPGLLSSYDRFIEKYIRHPNKQEGNRLEHLRRKLSPFILRRMKKDVLSELPPVSDIVYHCHLTEAQKELYRAHAKSAREELTKLVNKQGFDKVQIHVLATLTRLKQICCHPALFAKETPEQGDSAKYDMLMELLQNLIDGNHKTVIFSQYTRMLQIMKNDLQKQGIEFEYLDGSTKNRLEIVKRFNNEEKIPIFLVSLKAGGSGLNLVGADTVVHYDMWWNPAVENQATDRVHRIGQKKQVSSYKLVTLGTIEEKILELQERKKNLVRQVINTDEEAISKLTWEEVLELLQTT